MVEIKDLAKRQGGPGKKRIRAPNKRIIDNGFVKEWQCPFCKEVLNITKGDTIDRRLVEKHVNRNHADILAIEKKTNEKYGKVRTDFCLRQLTWPVEFKKMNAEEKKSAQFICPMCDMGLPKFDKELCPHKARYLQRLSKRHHLSKCKKLEEPISLQEYQNRFIKKIKYAQRLATMCERGHEPVVVGFNAEGSTKVHGQWMMVCKKCRSILRKAYGKNRPCKGKVMWRSSPGLAFWQVAANSKMLEETAAKLGLKSNEVADVQAALKMGKNVRRKL